MNGWGTATGMPSPPRGWRRLSRGPARAYRGTTSPEPSGSLPEILDDLLRALTATGQVVMLKVGGRTVYRAAG